MDLVPALDSAAAHVAQLRAPEALAAHCELERLAGHYPAFRFRTQGGWDHRQVRWVAERVRGMDAGLHTVITTDLDELRAALDAAPGAVTPPPRSRLP